MQRVVPVGLVLALSWIAPSHAQGVSDTSAVRSVVAGFAEAWNRHDMDAFGRLFTPDADFVNVAGSWWKGRVAIQHNHAYSHGTIPQADTAGFGGNPAHWGIFRHSTMRFDAIDIRFVRSDIALARVAWRLSNDARTALARTGMLLFVVVRDEGEWHIAAAHNTEIDRTVH